MKLKYLLGIIIQLAAIIIFSTNFAEFAANPKTYENPWFLLSTLILFVELIGIGVTLMILGVYWTVEYSEQNIFPSINKILNKKLW